MLILQCGSFEPITTEVPITALNALWAGNIPQALILPQIGHFFLVFPLAETAVSAAGTILDNNHYMFLTRRDEKRPFIIENANPDQLNPQALILMSSPEFIAEMAGFLDLPTDLKNLLHGIPLLRGDSVSRLLQQLAVLCQPVPNYTEAEELFFEILGQMLHLMVLRHQALLSLLEHKQKTITDLIPRLLQARQYIEARYLEPIKIQDVADHVALSEYHFARLFKSAFEVTVYQFILRLRLDEARHLLELTETSITDIAYAVGYKSLSAFINAFHHKFGLPPSAYRARFQKNKI